MLPFPGPLSGHMAQHIVLMNLLAPIAMLVLRRHLPRRLGRSLTAASVVQLLVLWGWHAPPALEAALGSLLLHLTMQASLLTAALWFWAAVVATVGEDRWRAMVALLITSKLFCLLGVLMVFAPRAIYAVLGPAAHTMHGGSFNPLADQQLAGLLMLVACPATYLVAGVVIATRWLGVLDETPATVGRGGPDG